MSTTVLLPQTEPRTAARTRPSTGLLTAVLCTVVALLLLGYHPWAEDGGIYASSLALRMQPGLFPAERGFAMAHTGRSLFVPALALLARAAHLSLPVALFTAYVLSLLATVLAAQRLLEQIFEDTAARRWSLVLFAASLGVPIAGTSLYLADPYLTARSISTPLLLWTVVLLLQRRVAAAWLCVAASATLHPLMTAWATLLLLTLHAQRARRPALWSAVLFVAAVLCMALVVLAAPADGAAAQAAALSRAYWFPRDWAWYEWVGMAAPALLLCIPFLPRRVPVTAAARTLSVAVAVSTVVVSAASLLLIQTGSRTMLLARLQPLRLLHTEYALFVLLVGGFAAHLRPRGRRWPVLLFCAGAAAGLAVMQRDLYRDSRHLELPWTAPGNGYERAFLWARQNTPADALFALDAEYTTAAGADAQVFRAVALRSSLPDAAKDGGIASVMPRLADAWLTASRAQSGLAAASDAERIARVQPLGATWIVLPAASATALTCPYVNEGARVCRLQ